MLLGVIGDDFTGSSDIGNMLARGGISTIQYAGLPGVPAQTGVESEIVSLRPARSQWMKRSDNPSMRCYGRSGVLSPAGGKGFD
jgi:uncharacterized protein YgbK (DUF1537 family)